MICILFKLFVFANFQSNLEFEWVFVAAILHVNDLYFYRQISTNARARNSVYMVHVIILEEVFNVYVHVALNWTQQTGYVKVYFVSSNKYYRNALNSLKAFISSNKSARIWTAFDVLSVF